MTISNQNNLQAKTDRKERLLPVHAFATHVCGVDSLNVVNSRNIVNMDETEKKKTKVKHSGNCDFQVPGRSTPDIL